MTFTSAAYAGINLLAVNLEGTTTGFIFEGNFEVHAAPRQTPGALVLLTPRLSLRPPRDTDARLIFEGFAADPRPL